MQTPVGARCPTCANVSRIPTVDVPLPFLARGLAAALMLGYSIGYLANALPVPGGIGVLDAGLVGALLLYGATPADAAAAGRTDCDHSSTIPGCGVRRSTYRSQDLRMTVVMASVGDDVASDCSGQ